MKPITRRRTYWCGLIEAVRGTAENLMTRAEAAGKARDLWPFLQKAQLRPKLL